MQFTAAVISALTALGLPETDLLGITVLQGSVVARLDLAGTAALVSARPFVSVPLPGFLVSDEPLEVILLPTDNAANCAFRL